MLLSRLCSETSRQPMRKRRRINWSLKLEELRACNARELARKYRCSVVAVRQAQKRRGMAKSIRIEDQVEFQACVLRHIGTRPKSSKVLLEEVQADLGIGSRVSLRRVLHRLVREKQIVFVNRGESSTWGFTKLT